jgi:hypothetical protein
MPKLSLLVMESSSGGYASKRSHVESFIPPSVGESKPQHWVHPWYTREFTLFFRFTTKNISSRTTSLLGNDFVIFWAKTKNGHLFVV